MSAQSADFPAPLVVQRWRRYGHDRAYVKQGEDDLGYRDLKTGEIHCTRPNAREAVAMATEALCARAIETAAAAEYQPRHGRPDGSPQPAATEPSRQLDRDLALNQPGEAARQQSRQLLAEAPVKLLIARAIGMKTDERNWHVGAQGEERTGRRLAKLDPRWRVLHAIPVGERGGDIDHVVIGPGGVFTVNVKNHPDASVWVGGDVIKVNGHTQFYVRNSRFEATRAAALLTAASGFDVEVRAIVAFTGSERGLKIKRQPEDGAVSVVGGRELVRHLSAQPEVLGAPSADRIYAVAQHLATWQPRTTQWQALPCDAASSTPAG